MAAIANSALLGLTTRFVVDIQGFDLGSWTSCKGLNVKFAHMPVKELGDHSTITYLPGRAEYSPVTLQRAMQAGDWTRTKTWLDSVLADCRFHKGERRAAATIRLRDSALGEVAAWTLRNVLPSAWNGPQFDASTSKVALETLELRHEGFLDD